MKFTDFPFNENILKGVEEMGFVDCMPVQAQTYEHILADRDVQAQSQTGTGKTAAFLIAIFHLMTEDERFRNRQAMVIAPTRELADQIEQEALGLGKFLPFKIGAFYGGVGYARQDRHLEEGVDIIIGTPGRLIDYSKSGKIKLGNIGIVVIDEADRLFDMGFLPDLRSLLDIMPHRESRRTLLYSATMNSRVSTLSWEYMNQPGDIMIEPDHIAVESITQELYHVAKDEKLRLLLGLLKREDPGNGIIFTNTKHEAVRLARRLEINGWDSRYLMGDMPQQKRNRIIADLKKGSFKILVATDVAARGLHIEGLDLVVNYDLPEDAENYVHRIGRTARAGKEGKAISLACEKFVFGLKAIEEFTQTKIPVVWFGDDELVQDKSAGMFISGDIDDAVGRGNDRDRGGARGSRDRGRSGEGRPDRGRGPGRSPERGPSRGRSASGRGAERGPGRQKRPHSLVSEATGATTVDALQGDGKNLGLPRNENRDRGRRKGGDDKRRSPGAADQKAPAPKAFVPGRKPEGGRKPEAGRKPGASQDRPRKDRPQTLEDRLAYYKSKYGEDFDAKNERKPRRERSQESRKGQGAEVQTGPASAKKDDKGKKGLLGRLVSLFRKDS